MAKTVNKSRNFTLAGGVQRYSRSALYKLKGAHKHKYPAVAPKAAKATTKTVTFGKGTRTISTKKTPKVYDVAQKAAVIVKRKAAPIKLRSSIKPGSVLIVLSGRYSGKRVVFLKQLTSGNLLVAGPYNLNGVPLRRVNQAYVIATSSSVDLSGVKVADTFNDAFFAKKAPAKGADGKFIKTDAKTKTVDKARVEATKALYKSLTAAVNKVPHLAQYLKTPFTLSKGQFPHALKF